MSRCGTAACSGRQRQTRRVFSLRSRTTIVEGDHRASTERSRNDRPGDDGSRGGAHLFHGTDSAVEAVASELPLR
jgi:hypothetical protein